MAEQPSLFDAGVVHSNDDVPTIARPARAQFLAGMLGAWLYGDKTVPKAARESLLGLAERTLAEADRIKELRS